MTAARWRNKHTGTLAHAHVVPAAESVGTVLEVVIFDDLFGPFTKLAEYSSWKEHWEIIPEVES